MKQFYNLVFALLISGLGFGQTSSDAWINEIHYDNSGADVNEAVEIVVADVATYPLANWRIQPYNGLNGEQIGGNQNGNNNFFSTPDAQSTSNGFTIASIDFTNLQNGGAPEGDGLALVYDDGTTLVVVQFLSYEGSFTATNGVADGMTTINIGESEGGSTLATESLQLSGTGSQYSDFTWQEPAAHTRGLVNNGQIIGVPNTDTSVEFVSTSTSISEDVGTTDLTFSITNADATNATTFDVVLTSGDASDINGYVTQSVTFPAASSANETLTITVTDDMIFEGDETLTFTIENVTGGNNASFGTNNSFELNITENDPVPAELLIITEVMQDPVGVTDANGEYFEVYNPTDNAIDMNGWTISDNASNSHLISGSVIVPSQGFAVLGRNGMLATNGGVVVDYMYSSFVLGNTADKIIINDNNDNLIDFIEYDGGPNWPDPTGAAMIYNGSDIENNNDGSLWVEATVAEGIDTDFGSPGINGTGQIVNFLVFKDGSWNTIPTPATGAKNALIKADESVSVSTNVSVADLFVKEGADLTVDTGVTLTLNNLNLESVSNSYSSLILNGDVVGTVNYSRFVNEDGSGATGGNDLISAPLSGQTWSDFLSTGTNEMDLLNNGGTPIVYGFAPFDKNAPTPDFINYDASTDATLTSGKGYRTATDIGKTLTFTGIPDSGPMNVPVNLEYVGSEFIAWNLIGNPFPSFIDIEAFFNTDAGPGVKNIDIIDANSGIYGYDGNVSDGWEVITLANATGRLMAPGQGFFVAADQNDVDDFDIQFNTDIRRVATDLQFDDFIEERNSNNLTYLELKASTDNNAYITDFYFNDNATTGLDAGYDAIIFGGAPPIAFALYSLLVNDNSGQAIALQALNTADVNNITIPLGLNANQGEQLTFSINEISLPETIEVYLEDNVENTATLLNTSDYIFTPSSDLNGAGRFFIRFTNSVLSTPENILDQLNVFTNQNDKSIVISGQLESRTNASVYDLQGRLVTSKLLDINSVSQSIDVNSLNSGIYIVHLEGSDFKRSIKIILK